MRFEEGLEVVRVVLLYQQRTLVNGSHVGMMSEGIGKTSQHTRLVLDDKVKASKEF